MKIFKIGKFFKIMKSKRWINFEFFILGKYILSISFIFDEYNKSVTVASKDVSFVIPLFRFFYDVGQG